jgi:hypothetical protein
MFLTYSNWNPSSNRKKRSLEPLEFLLCLLCLVPIEESVWRPTDGRSCGRDHWSTLFPAVIAGAGIPGRNVIGKSDKDAAYALERVIYPEDLTATVYHALGIDPEMRVLDVQNRPTPIVDGGRPVFELWN